MSKYVLYARKSSESEDRQVKSLDAQETEMLAIAQREGLNIVEIIRESHSAKTTNQRPEFNRMMKGIKTGNYSGILTWAPDRISRNAGDLGLVIDLMDAGKLECVKTYSQTFYNDPYSKFMFLMLGSQAKLENDQRSLNVKRGNREKLKRGEWLNLAPIGYINDRAIKKIFIDPIQSPFVIKMFKLYSTGLYSFNDLANTLYDQGLRNRCKGKIYGGHIQRIINNPVYYGIIESAGKFFNAIHQPLVTKELFDKCQSVSGNKSRPRAKTKGFMLSGFITCKNCSCAITAEIKKGKYIYYHCTNGRGNCDQKSKNATEKTIDNFIAKDMEELYISQKMIDIVYRAKLEELSQSETYDNHALDTVQKALDSLTERRSRLVDTFTAGDIDEALYRHKLQTIDNEKVIFTKQLEQLQLENPDPYATIELVYNRFKQGNTMAERYKNASPEEKRIILSDSLSNSFLLNRNIVDIQYQKPYSSFRNAPKKPSFLEMRKMWDSNITCSVPVVARLFLKFII